ncbi:3-hydroxyacyl-CoA dehydrogenase family protein [Luoshenia tenuis]|jgi:3-hydroxybutyryl-CoA dehydrogenase|uniref:3-hydroxyacyl-CoA dehydrogenase family protein n=1 Tax=Luoshenia tenuis TaxID=2763654 RepID=UPI003D91AC90
MELQKLRTLVIAGAGLMGASMAQQFAGAGYPVTLYDISQQALEKGRRLIALNQSQAVESGASIPTQAEALRGRIAYTTDKECFGRCQLVVESIVEDMAIKQDFWREVSALTPPDCVLATNTSGLSITAIATAVQNPGRFVGMHWFNPAHLIPLVEVISGQETAPETAEFVYALAESIGKKPIRVQKDAPGFIANRLQLAILREALHIAESGIGSIEDVDRCMKYGLGLRYACLGPFEVCDLGGLDTFYHIAQYLFPDLSDVKQPTPLLTGLYQSGAYGVKAGRGFYNYSAGKADAAVKERDRLFLKAKGILDGED